MTDGLTRLDKKAFSAAAYRSHAQQKQAGEPWTAPSGAVVRVRKPDLQDQATLNLLPTECRQTVYQAIDATFHGQSPSDTMFRSGEEIVAAAYRLAAAYVLAGWLEPRVVYRDEDVTDPDTQITVDQVLPDDRAAFMLWCQGSEGGAAQAPVAFPQRQAPDMGTVSDLPDLRAAAV